MDRPNHQYPLYLRQGADMAGFFRGLFGAKSPIQESEVSDIYRQMRQQLLSTKPTDIGLSPDVKNQVWAVLMETGYRFPRSVASLVTIADSTVSLYLSTGGGVIGAGQHVEPRQAGADLLSW